MFSKAKSRRADTGKREGKNIRFLKLKFQLNLKVSKILSIT